MNGFAGGVHPPESKRTAGQSIETAPLPGKVILPLSQHTGSPSKPLVKPKDTVKAGQKIAESSGFISSTLHASISGKITAIDHFISPSGLATEAIVIESDGADEKEAATPRDWRAIEPAEIARIVSESGIVGLGGAAFPTHVKLSPPKDKPIDTVILNGCECEPCLTCDHRVMLESPGGIVEGLAILMKALNVGRGIIAIEDNKPDAARAVAEAAAKSDAAGGIRVATVRTKYPQGAEKQLIKSAVNREVPSGGLPMHAGVSVQNVQTALAVREAVACGKPLYERVLTVTGNVAESRNLRVRLGTPVSEIVAHCGGLREKTAKVVSGGPMMGATLFSLDVPVTKGMSGIVALTESEARAFEPTPCIRCGRCISACPMALSPTVIARWVETKGAESGERVKGLHVMDCIECASCAYECPARIELVSWMKLGKIAARKVKP